MKKMKKTMKHGLVPVEYDQIKKLKPRTRDYADKYYADLYEM